MTETRPGEAGIALQNIHKSYTTDLGTTRIPALQGVSLHVNPGELFVILGPSGCGKSTLLRCVAGLEEPEYGSITLGRRTVFDPGTGLNVSASERKVGMVFQDYALYPHMTVERNVAFGLKTRKVPKSEIPERTRQALKMVEMDQFATRRPAHLSGGQRQRVALARAVAANPGILLFDEPLSNLDPVLRSMLRGELRQLIRQIGTTTLFVTHDQEEAMILGDRLAVMNKGKVEQIGAPDEVYRTPETIFVARFTGRPTTNLVEGIVERHESRWILVPVESRAATLRLPEDAAEFRGQRIMLHMRLEDLVLTAGEGHSAATRLRTTAVLPEGSHTYIQFDLGGPYEPLMVRDTTHLAATATVGDEFSVGISRAAVYSLESGYRLKEIAAGAIAAG
mgnify:FL=1